MKLYLIPPIHSIAKKSNKTGNDKTKIFLVLSPNPALNPAVDSTIFSIYNSTINGTKGGKNANYTSSRS